MKKAFSFLLMLVIYLPVALLLGISLAIARFSGGKCIIFSPVYPILSVSD